MSNLTLTRSPELFQTPTHDPDYMRLGDDLRDLVNRRLAIMQEIAFAPKVAPAIRAIVLRLAGQRGCGKGTILNLYYSFLRTGSWRVLLDKAKAGPGFYDTIEAQGLPHPFKMFIAGQWCLRKRGKFRPVWVDLKTQYQAWRRGVDCPVEGYAVCPEPRPDTGLPDGWTYENLFRIAKANADDYERAFIADGPKAAHRIAGPKKINSRYDHESGRAVEVGEFFLFDDSWNDFEVFHRGRPSRILSLHALDLASACNVLRGHKPTEEDEHGVEQRLKEREMIFLVAALLSTIGFRPAGTTLICEKGTATIRGAEADLLAQITGEKIIVRTGPQAGGSGVLGLCCERGGGNPNWKAPIESFFNLLRNRTDHMLEFPGQIGNNARLTAPEGLGRMMAQDEALHRAMTLLPESKQKLILFNLLNSREAMAALDARVEFCNTRREHEIEGWRECGYHTPAFRLAENLDYLPAAMIDRLSPDQQTQLRVMLAANPKLRGEIRLHPREVFEAGREKLRRFSASQTALLLSRVEDPKYRKELGVDGGYIPYECPDIDASRPLLYGPFWRDGQGRQEVMRADDRFSVIANPCDPRAAFLFDAKGGYIGVAPVAHGAIRDDVEASERQYKAHSQVVAAYTESAKKLAAPITRRAARIAKNNAAVFSGHDKEQNNLAAAAQAALLRSENSQ